MTNASSTADHTGGDQSFQGGTISNSTQEITTGPESFQVHSNEAARDGRGQRSRYTDTRLDDDQAEAPQTNYDLSAFIKLAKPKKRGQKPVPLVTKGSDENVERHTATCPVCGQFEGDEAAVAHHVEGHFG